MASSTNRVIITGNLTRDPELRSLPSGTSVCELRVAVNSQRKDESGNWVDKPNYFNVKVWGAQGENCSTYLSKGRRSPSTAASTGASGRARTVRSGSRSTSSPTGSSSSAAVTAAARAAGLGSAPSPTSPPTPRISAPSPSERAPGRPTTTSRSRARPRRPRTRPAPALCAGARRAAPRARLYHPQSAPPRGGAFARDDRHTREIQEQLMARRQRHRSRDRGPPQGRFGDRFRPRKYTRINVENIDYKDLTTLRRFISDRGKVRSRRVTGSRAATSSSRPRDPAGARARAAALRRRSLAGGAGDPAQGRRDLGGRAMPSTSFTRLPAQLPLPRKLAEPATDASLEEAQRRREPRRRPPGTPRSGRSRLRRCSRRRCSRSSTARARTESSTDR